MVFISRRILSRKKVLDFLNELENIKDEEFRSLYLLPHPSLAEIEVFVKDMTGKYGIPPKLPDIASKSKTGAAFFWSTRQGCLILPPFPIAEKHLSRTITTGPLRSLLQHDYKIALMLVRLGSYAIGICKGENIITSKVGTGLVHGRHKKGGSSAHRFERHRDKQIEYFLTRVCQHAREHIEPHIPSLDYTIYGGARTTILLLQKRCPFLAGLDIPELPPLLDIQEPRQAVLLSAISRVWSSSVTEWRED